MPTSDEPVGGAFFPASGGSGGALTVEQNGTVVDDATTVENFTGSGVNVVDTTPGIVQIDVPGFQGLFRSPDGSCWKVTIANDGTPTYTKVTCPGSAAPGIIAGGVFGGINNHKSGGNPIDSPDGPWGVTAGKLVVVAVMHYTSQNVNPATSVSDSLGNVWTEHSSGWSGSDPDSFYMKLSLYTAIIAASGNTVITVHQDGTQFCAVTWGAFEVQDFNPAGPFGVSGTSVFIGHSTSNGELYSLFTPTVGTPAPNSLVIAVSCNFFINGFQPPDPSVYTDDPAFVNVYHQDPQNPWGSNALRIDTNSGGATSSLWTDIPSPANGVGTLMMAIGYLLEIRAP